VWINDIINHWRLRSWAIVAYAGMTVCTVSRESAMECSINAFGQPAINALHAGELLHAGRFHAGKTAKRLEQGRAAARTDAGNILEHAALARFLAALAMAGDGKPMRLVAHSRHQVQRRR